MRSPTSPGSAPCSPSSASPRRSSPVRWSTTCAAAADHRRRHPHRPRPEPRRHPAHPGPRTDLAAARRRRVGFARDRDRLDRRSRVPDSRPRASADRLGGRSRQRARRLARVVRARRDLRGRLDAVHRDHPRRDPDDGRHLGDDRSRARSCWSPTRSASGCRSSRIALVYDRAPRPHPRRSSGTDGSCPLIGGLLVAFIGVAMIFDWLALLPRYFTFNTAI